MNLLKIALASAAASVALGGAAMAQDLDLSYNAGVASDYVFRGISNSNEDPQVFGGIDATYGIGYAGVWASTVDFGLDEPTAEIDIYAGVKPTVGDVTLDLGLVYYGYLDDKGLTPGSFSYLEVKAAASKAFGPATLGVAAYYSPEFPGKTGEALYLELNGAMPIAEKLTLSGAVGNQEIDLGTSYSTWNVGVGYAITDNLSADVRYSDTNEDFGDLAGSRFTVSLKAAF
jgi:uncharacterized protein (TIGR02001 family)